MSQIIDNRGGTSDDDTLYSNTYEYPPADVEIAVSNVGDVGGIGTSGMSSPRRRLEAEA